MIIHKYLKEQRIFRGQTQQELAGLAQISIATLQNIEAGKSNLTMDVLEKLMTALNFKIVFEPLPLDWDQLCEYGLPLTSLSNRAGKAAQHNKKHLAELLYLACRDLEKKPRASDHERKKESLGAYLFAIKNHYSSFYKQISRSELIQEYTPTIKSLSEKQIKLYRYSKDLLGKIL